MHYEFLKLTDDSNDAFNHKWVLNTWCIPFVVQQHYQRNIEGCRLGSVAVWAIALRSSL